MKKLLPILILGCLAHADQVNCIKWKNLDATTAATYCKPFSVRAGSGVAFSNNDLDRVLTISSTAVASGAGGSDTQVQFNLGGVLSGSSGLTWNDSTKTLSATHIAGASNRPWIDATRDCTGIVADGVTDDGAAINTCLQAQGQLGRTVFLPKTAATATGCDYYSTVTLIPYGSIEGAGSIWQNGTGLTNTNICFASGVTGIDLELVQCRGSCSIRNLGILSKDDFGQLQSPTKFVIPQASAMTEWDRNISAIQRASNVLTVTVSAVNGVGEKLYQVVGSTVSISGVVGDATMNGLCIITALSGQSSGFTDNAGTFTCTQLGADSGPFGAVGKISLPTTGINISDGIRVCGNFYVFDHVSVQGFARWGINGDANAGEGCINLFADDLTVRESTLTNNQVGGFYTRGTDSSVDLFNGNSFYYNGGYCAVDASALGNTYIGNNCSNNGALWATSTTPATKTISTISRTSGVVSVVLSQADTNLKQGSCVVIAGVTDTSFNTATPPAGTATQCFFVTTLTDSTHYTYIQPGNPADASSSGGTSRYAKFSETYLSSGIDSGAWKMGIGASASADTLMLNNYVEGGQNCKMGITVLAIQGANTPCSSTIFEGSFISTQFFAAGAFGSNLTNLGNKNDGAGGYLLQMHSGKTVSNHEYLQWDTFDNLIGWRLDVLPTGTNGANGLWHLTSDGVGQSRIVLFGSNNTGHSDFSAAGTGAVRFNRNFAGTNAGTGGVEFWSGGASPAKVSAIDSAGLGTFNGGVKAGSSGSTIADSRELLQNVHLCGTTTTCANTANGSYRMIFGNVALSTGTALVSSIAAFTSNTSYVCTGTDKTAIAAVQIVNTSSSSFTINGTGSDSVDYICVGK